MKNAVIMMHATVGAMSIINRSSRYMHILLNRRCISSSSSTSLPFLPPPATLVSTAISAASLLSQTPVLYARCSALQAADFAIQHLKVSPGSRCLVLTSPRGGPRAGSLLASLRRRGFAPLALALPDVSPSLTHASLAAAAARRAGATWVIGVGGAATIAVARGTAMILGGNNNINSSNGSMMNDPSVPLLSVPSCPSGAELTRDALLFDTSAGLTSMKMHPKSLQAAVCDSEIAASLEGEASVTIYYSLLIHSLEIFLRTLGDDSARAQAWFALEMAARSLQIAVEGGNNSSSTASSSVSARSARDAATAASVLVGSAMLLGPLGPARSTALAIASRYSISYSAALTAVAPAAISASLELLLDTVETEREEREEEDGDIVVGLCEATLSRYALAGQLLSQVVSRDKSSTSFMWSNINDVLQQQKSENNDSGEIVKSASLLVPALIQLRNTLAISGGLANGTQTLEDFGLSETDLSAIADVAELLDDNTTIASFAALRRADFSRILQES